MAYSSSGAQEDGVVGSSSVGNNEASTLGGEDEVCKGATLAADLAGFGSGPGNTNDGIIRGDGTDTRGLSRDVCFKVAEGNISRNRDTVILGGVNIENESSPCVGVEVACVSAVLEAETAKGRAENRLGRRVRDRDSDISWCS